MDHLKLYARSENSLESLIQTAGVFSNDIGMEFGVEKCAVFKMKKRKMANRNKYMSNFITKIHCCLSRLDRGRIRANGEKKKINDNALGIQS